MEQRRGQDTVLQSLLLNHSGLRMTESYALESEVKPHLLDFFVWSQGNEHSVSQCESEYR